MSDESATSAAIDTPPNTALEFVDADELAKRYKLEHIQRIHRKVQEADFYKGQSGRYDQSKFSQYKNLLWRYAVELAPLIEDALERGLLDFDDIRIIPELDQRKSENSQINATVLGYARYRGIPDELYQNGAQERAVLQVIYERLVRLEHRMRLGFTFEDSAQGELFIDELTSEE